MSVDLNKVRGKKDEEAQKSFRSSSSFSYWNPRDGKNRIRLMPPWTDQPPNDGQFWREIYVHWKVDGKLSFACPAKTPHSPNKDCPICDEEKRLKATKDPVDAEQANNIRSKQRLYSNIVDLDDPVYRHEDVLEWKAKQNDKTRDCPFNPGHTKVQVFSYGPTILKDLLDVFAEGIDITDLNTGRDVLITKEGKDRATRYRVRVEFTPTVFQLHGELELVNLDHIMEFKDTMMMNAALHGADPAPAVLPAPRTSAALPAPGQTPTWAKAAPEDEPPACFKDPNVYNTQDPECVGGMKNGEEFDRCPFFAPCGQAVSALKTTTGSRRGAKSTPKADTTDDEMAKLEAEMKSRISR